MRRDRENTINRERDSTHGKITMFYSNLIWTLETLVTLVVPRACRDSRHARPGGGGGTGAQNETINVRSVVPVHTSQYTEIRVEYLESASEYQILRTSWRPFNV